jgi:hypothetical protein
MEHHFLTWFVDSLLCLLLMVFIRAIGRLPPSRFYPSVLVTVIVNRNLAPPHTYCVHTPAMPTEPDIRAFGFLESYIEVLHPNQF